MSSHSRAPQTSSDLAMCRSAPSAKRTPKQPLTAPTRERPSNQVSINHHLQQWTPADTGGRCFPGQAGRSAGSPHRALASGRRGQQQSSSRRSPQHDLCLVQHDLAVRLACPLRCRITPYLIKAAPHSGAAARRQRPGLSLGRPARAHAGPPAIGAQIRTTRTALARYTTRPSSSPPIVQLMATASGPPHGCRFTMGCLDPASAHMGM